MSTYSIPTLLQLWRQAAITVEQAMGYSLQQIATLHERQDAVEKRLRLLEGARPDQLTPKPRQEPPKS